MNGVLSGGATSSACWRSATTRLSDRPRNLTGPPSPEAAAPPYRPENHVPPLAPLSVQVIAYTHFEPPPDVLWDTDADGGQALAEFAGRA